MPSTQRILVISLRYLGDALLTTPLIHALQKRYPSAKIDVLAFKGVESMLENNPDIYRVITISAKPRLGEQLTLIKQIARKYDLAVIPQTGDKPHIYAWFAAAERVGLVPQKSSTTWWKKRLLQHGLTEDPELHRTIEYQRLAQALGCTEHITVQPPRLSNEQKIQFAERHTALQTFIQQAFVVIHPSPRWRYKQWEDSSWVYLCEKLAATGLHIIISGGPGQEEAEYITRLLNQLPEAVRAMTMVTQGQLSFAELSHVLQYAQLYVGPDTGTTHLAAACGIPTVALFGPTDPRLWGPTPVQGWSEQWQAQGPVQQQGNIILMQALNEHTKDCLPCQQEGCERHRHSHSVCMQTLRPEDVWKLVYKQLNP